MNPPGGAEMLASFITTETQVGEPVSIGDTTIVPMAKSLRFQIPKLQGGLIWNRPVSLLVREPDGNEEVLHIRDVTRRVQFGLILGSLAGLLAVWFVQRLSKEEDK